MAGAARRLTGLGALLALSLLAPDLAARGQAPVTFRSQILEPLEQLNQDITAATTAPGVQRATWGIAVDSLDWDERVFELNPATRLVPASTVKLISVASAAEAVGWDFTFETTVRATDGLVGGRLRGDLIVVGSGDPSIGGRGGQPLSAWVDALKAIGLRRVEGRVIGDDDAVEEPRPQLAWAWDDLGYQTGALFGALNLNENQMVVTIAPGASTDSAPALSVEPSAASRPIRNRTVTGPRGSPRLLWPEQRPGEPFLTIAGSIPVGSGPARLAISVGNPTAWFAATLRHALIAGGIAVTGEAYDVDDVEALPQTERRSMLLLSHRSPTLAEIAQPTLKESINLYGEAILRLNAAQGGLPTNDAALEGLQTRLGDWGISPEAWHIVDGSGLSRRNAVAPEALVAVLRRMYEPSGTSPWMTALPIAGRDGSLAGRMKGTPAENNVRAKTGTMTDVRTLAGYLRTRDGETLAFAILLNNFEGSSAEATAAVDRIVVHLAGFSRGAK
jgi:D-alanyl-D-alanine carboxypeptidase/D-alanyl-D-alanine-endopeptidase (penicillin-binding protein 4)